MIPPEPPVTPTNSISEGFSSVLDLPYCEPFDTTPGLFPLYFSNGSGPSAAWAYTTDDSPGEEYCCEDADDSTNSCSNSMAVSPSQSFGTDTVLSETNVNEAFFTADDQTLFREVVSDVKMLTPTLGARSNAGV